LCRRCPADPAKRAAALQIAGAAAHKWRLGPAQTDIWTFAKADIAKQSIAAFLNTLP
jgi:hypothetical protein